MKAQSRLVLGAGVGLGYFLGRTRKMRLAMMIAGAGATGVLGSPRQLLQRGLSQLGTSADLGSLTEAARGQLVGAAKTAAATAASSRIDALTERLQAKASGNGSEPDADDEPRDESDESSEPDEQPEDEDEAKDEDEQPEAKHVPERPRRRSTRRRAGETDDKPRRSGRTRTPVRRAGR